MLNIVTITNITTEPFFGKSLLKRFTNHERIEYKTVLCEEIHNETNEAILHSANYIIILINFSEYLETILSDLLDKSSHKDIVKKVSSDAVKIYNYLRNNFKGYIIWFGFEMYDDKLKYICGHTYLMNNLIDDINLTVNKHINVDDVYIDLKEIIAEIGIDNAYSIKNKYRWLSPYSETLWENVATEIHRQYLIHNGITKKCLILDCDNVLWGGILSEDGIENIHLGSNGIGRIYQDFQKYVLSLYKHGVILAICSKNDIDDVKTVFCKHSDMILKEEHIACFIVNWDKKPDNIKRISETLKIGLDSIVFVDDSPVEIEAIKVMLPQVTTVLFEKYMNYNKFTCFNLKKNINISDIKKRSLTYQTNGLREELKSTSLSYADYIESLNVKVDIHKVNPIEYSRIAELTQRTNKYTNGQRYTVNEIKERVQRQGITLYSVSVSDRFSDLGLVGAMEVENDSLVMFSLSCRALGRKVEDKMITYLLGNHCISNMKFISTNKNGELYKVLSHYFTDTKISERIMN